MPSLYAHSEMGLFIQYHTLIAKVSSDLFPNLIGDSSPTRSKVLSRQSHPPPSNNRPRHHRVLHYTIPLNLFYFSFPFYFVCVNVSVNFFSPFFTSAKNKNKILKYPAHDASLSQDMKHFVCVCFFVYKTLCATLNIAVVRHPYSPDACLYCTKKLFYT